MASHGPARAGSRLQMQVYVNSRADELSAVLREAFPELNEASVEWVSPLEADDYREYRDGAFLEKLNLERHRSELGKFWPARGPVWDGLATAGESVILAEAKSYPDEFYSTGCKAEAAASVEKIRQALARTQEWLGLDPDPERWMYQLREDEPSSSLYQSANRYSHLFFLREVAGVDACLAHVLFLEDHTFKPATRDDWVESLIRIEDDLGLRGVDVPYAGHVFLHAAVEP
jgi:hypothetical protein